MKINTTINDSVAILAVEGSLSSDERISFEKEVNHLKDSQCNLVLDLSNVTFIDSASLGMIVKFYSMFQKNGRHLILANMSKQIYEVFKLTGVTRQIQIFDSTQAAVKFIRGNS